MSTGRLIVAVMNGWGASIIPVSMGLTRTSQLVARRTALMDRAFWSTRANIFRTHRRTFMEYVIRHAQWENVLLVVGKSFGAKQEVEGMNKLGSILSSYRKTAFLSIDPCWPKWGSFDFTPNRNADKLMLKAPVDLIRNIYVRAEHRRQQCGARITIPSMASLGGKLRNIPVHGTDHYRIVEHPVVEQTLIRLLRYLTWDMDNGT